MELSKYCLDVSSQITVEFQAPYIMSTHLQQKYRKRIGRKNTLLNNIYMVLTMAY
jgi:hypothetical protein